LEAARIADIPRAGQTVLSFMVQRCTDHFGIQILPFLNAHLIANNSFFSFTRALLLVIQNRFFFFDEIAI